MKNADFDLKLPHSLSAETWLGRWGREHPAAVLFWSVRGSHINAMFGDPADRQRCYDAAVKAKMI